MTVHDYIIIAKAELDQFEEKWRSKNSTEPENYPSELEEDEWNSQELAERFGLDL